MLKKLKAKLRVVLFASKRFDWENYWKTLAAPVGGVGLSQGKTPDERKESARFVTETLELKETDELLDVGCGDGTFSTLLPCIVLGVDLPEVIRNAVIPTIAGDICHIPVPKQYDKVLVAGVLHCTISEKDVPQALKELRRVGKQVLLMRLPDKKAKQKIISTVPRTSLKLWNSMIWFSPEALVTLAKEAGFKEGKVLWYTPSDTTFNLLLS
jgi:hypothetical protein